MAFDFDNRPGISANSYCVGGPGAEGGGTPEKYPHGFRTGTVVRDNYVFATGRIAIAFSGDGTVCANNVIRFVKDVWRPTNTGTSTTYGSSTNDNRAVQMRGYRWVVEGNDYEVYSNFSSDRVFLINDGEGLMHEAHCNSTVKGGRLVGNKGNTYLSIFNTGGVEGLVVEGNEIRVRKDAAIYVVADRHKQPRSACRDVRIVGNRTEGGGIVLAGDPASGNVIAGNKHLGGPRHTIHNRAAAKVEGNEGYTVTEG